MLRLRAPGPAPRLPVLPPSLPEPADAERLDGYPRGMAAYLRDMRRHPLLSRDEEHEVAVRFAETRDRALGDRLVQANLRLVLKVALEYRMSRRNLTDLVQEGNLGLLQAVEKYDPHRGVKLATYAVWWIRAYMLKFILGNARLVKVGTTSAQRKVFFGMGAARRRLAARSGGEVGAKDIADALGVSEGDVTEMEMRLGSSDASLDSPAYRNDEDSRLAHTTSGDADGVDDVLAGNELRARAGLAFRAFEANLAGRDREIFRRRLLCEAPVTLYDLAQEMGVSRERVRQIEVRLKKRLRAHLETAVGPDVGTLV
ncbi:MAG TPA: sigma-70 family RNA polymerase sigma factor [Polyangia bacterium]|nr:sigma-70 family RNA polymerase sigma factor [Polyangia bacterium]